MKQLNFYKKISLLFFIITGSCQLHGQRVNLKDYFYPSSKEIYNLRFCNVTDSNTCLNKTIRVLGKDSIEVIDYSQENKFIKSLVFVVHNDSIVVRSGRAAFDSGTFSSEIISGLWAQSTTRKIRRYHFNLHTSDTCNSPMEKCYWRWERHKQTGFKKGKIKWKGKSVYTITIQMEQRVLFQPKFLSSVSGASTYSVTYTFAKGSGLIKMDTRSKRYHFSSTLIRLD